MSENKKVLSGVESVWLEKSGRKLVYLNMENIGIIEVDNFPALGELTALRFIEWVQQNPGGVISLPTGKTPEHFIKKVTHYLNNWNTKSCCFSSSSIRLSNNVNAFPYLWNS